MRFSEYLGGGDGLDHGVLFSLQGAVPGEEDQLRQTTAGQRGRGQFYSSFTRAEAQQGLAIGRGDLPDGTPPAFTFQAVGVTVGEGESTAAAAPHGAEGGDLPGGSWIQNLRTRAKPASSTEGPVAVLGIGEEGGGPEVAASQCTEDVVVHLKRVSSMGNLRPG